MVMPTKGEIMVYWEITPHENNDYDSAIMPAETEADHRAALEYAKARLESLWDSLACDDGLKAVTIELKTGVVPDFDDEE
jgi:hypothetical protein